MFWIIIVLAAVLLVGWTVWVIYEEEPFQIWGLVSLAIVFITALIIAIYGCIVDNIDWKYEDGKKVEEYELIS